MSFEKWSREKRERFERHMEKNRERLEEPEHAALKSCREVYQFLLEDRKDSLERGETAMMESLVLGGISRYTLPGGEQCWVAIYLGRPVPSDSCGVQVIGKRDGQYVFILND